jgi:hypothetical protein
MPKTITQPRTQLTPTRSDLGRRRGSGTGPIGGTLALRGRAGRGRERRRVRGGSVPGVAGTSLQDAGNRRASRCVQGRIDRSRPRA